MIDFDPNLPAKKETYLRLQTAKFCQKLPYQAKSNII